MELLQIASSFGFPAFFSVILFITYRDMVRRVIEVVEANTQALRDVSNWNAQVATRLSKLEEAVASHRHAESARS